MKFRNVFLAALILLFTLVACQNTSGGSPIEVSFDMGVNEEKQIAYNSGHDVVFSSDNESVVTVSNSGLLKALSTGVVIVKATNKTDSTLSEKITITVLGAPNTILIKGTTTILFSETTKMEITPFPESASKNVVWEADDDIISISDDGLVTALSDGKTILRAKSKSDEEITDSVEITVKNMVIVDSTKSEGDVYTYNKGTFTFGKSLFSNLADALDKAIDDTEIHVFGGTISEATTVLKNNITLIGKQSAKITNSITVSANNFSISGFSFSKNGRINVPSFSEGIHIEDCEFKDITGNSTLISLANVKNFTLKNSSINTPNTNAVEVTVTNGDILIRKNTITSAKTAITVNMGSEHTGSESIDISRNTISNVETALNVDLLDSKARAFARYNKITNYSSKAVIANSNNEMDFSLNYWGTFDLSKFENVSEYYLAGHYEKESDMLSESFESANAPALIIINNIVDEINVNDGYKFELSFLPYEFKHQDGNITFTSSDRDIVSFTALNELIIKKSGNVDLSVQSTLFGAIRTTMNVDIITDPGINLTPSSIAAAFTLSDELSFETLVFPFTIADSPVSFRSSNENVATIDSNGVVTPKNAGTVTFIASINLLNKDGSLKEVVEGEFTTVFFDSLNTNNLLDYLTLNHTSVVPGEERLLVRGWNLVYYYTGIIGPSYYGYDDFTITQSLIPEGSSARPGLNDPLPENVPKYNDKNIYWVVFHDTADSKMGAADYGKMLTNPDSGTEVSWHYTVDDKEVHQHLPEGEIGYHAGDGRTNPGTSENYLGGGNRNGVGIESSVKEGDDIFKVWLNGAKLVAQILVRNNLPLENAKYHQDFSGKLCPETMIKANKVDYFEKLKEVEYTILKNFPGATIKMESSNKEYLTNDGRVSKMPEKSITIKYTITVTHDNKTEQRDLYLYLEGTLV
ncbi:Ig-like domain-containing protein [Acholeplasma sp. OttesenSCG-928-E16]|nr:Ig-like domain-containing protein [Acholeplasma sp. OttesenSCG-928-E16]